MISQPSWQADRKNVGAFFERWKNARGETADAERLVHDFLAVLGKDIADISEDRYEQLLDFISLFQGVMNKDIRREIGAHYTNVENILKVIDPLFILPWNSVFFAANELRVSV